MVHAGETFGRAILGASTADMLEMGELERRRVFNLGYYTWVEQQNVTVEEFQQRREQEFWQRARAQLPAWDALIQNFNSRTGVSYAECVESKSSKSILAQVIQDQVIHSAPRAC